jgi:hypothetical protein
VLQLRRRMHDGGDVQRLLRGLLLRQRGRLLQLLPGLQAVRLLQLLLLLRQRLPVLQRVLLQRLTTNQ